MTTSTMIRLMLHSVATGLLFIGLFGYAIQSFNPVSPILIAAGIILLVAGWKSRDLK